LSQEVNDLQLDSHFSSIINPYQMHHMSEKYQNSDAFAQLEI